MALQAVLPASSQYSESICMLTVCLARGGCPAIQVTVWLSRHAEGRDVPGSLNNEAKSWKLTGPVADHGPLVHATGLPIKLSLYSHMH